MDHLTSVAERFGRLRTEIVADSALYVVDTAGAVLHRYGTGDEPLLRMADGQLQVEPGDDRDHLVLPLPEEGYLVAVLPKAAGACTQAAMATVLETLLEQERLERELESMSAGSASLLEELSVVEDTLPLMATRRDAGDVIAEALLPLIVATSVERAVYIAFEPSTGVSEVLVYVTLGDDGFKAQRVPYPLAAVFPTALSAAARVLTDGAKGWLGSDEKKASLEVDCPDELCRSQLLVVPVTCGDTEHQVLLGALMVMDKRPSAFSQTTTLGSQEMKLTLAVAAMLGAVLGARRVAEMAKELATAQEIQEQILPPHARAVPGFQLASRYVTSGSVGGDYFDYLQMKDGRVMVVIADVSGHNLASGMVMVSARAALRVLAGTLDDPATVFESLGRAMEDDLSRTERFITAAAATLRPGQRQVEVTSAGHNDLMWYRVATGDVERIASEDTIFGFMRGAEYSARSIEMAEGDVLLLYTDGVTEAQADNDEMFGEERLCAVLQDAAGGSAEEVIEAVYLAVAEFASSSERGDDITAVAIKAVKE